MIKATNLTMYYGPVAALSDVSFEVNKGEIAGLLGPNGAGKSTTMKILTTYLYPTKGTAKVGGVDVLDDPVKVRKIIGYLPEVLPLYMDMEVRAYLEFVGRARGLHGGKLNERIRAVVEATDVRLAIAAAFPGVAAFEGIDRLAFARPLEVRHWLQASNPSERWKWDFLYQDLPPVKGHSVQTENMSPRESFIPLRPV